jgi:hypothetical protein
MSKQLKTFQKRKILKLYNIDEKAFYHELKDNKGCNYKLPFLRKLLQEIYVGYPEIKRYSSKKDLISFTLSNLFFPLSITSDSESGSESDREPERPKEKRTYYGEEESSSESESEQPYKRRKKYSKEESKSTYCEDFNDFFIEGDNIGILYEDELDFVKKTVLSLIQCGEVIGPIFDIQISNLEQMANTKHLFVYNTGTAIYFSGICREFLSKRTCISRIS